MTTHQRDFGWMQVAREPHEEGTELLLKIPNFRRVLRWQFINSGLSLAKLAERLGMGKSHLSEVLNERGRKCLNPDLYRAFCYATGSWGIYQWFELERRQERQTERDALLARLAELDASEAA